MENDIALLKMVYKDLSKITDKYYELHLMNQYEHLSQDVEKIFDRIFTIKVDVDLLIDELQNN